MLDGFAIVEKKGERGFTGVYEDDLQIAGFKKRGTVKDKKIGDFDEEEHKQQQERLQAEVDRVIKSCEEKEEEAKANFNILVGHQSNSNPTIQGRFIIGTRMLMLPKPFNKLALKQRVGDQDIENLTLSEISGDNEAIN